MISFGKFGAFATILVSILVSSSHAQAEDLSCPTPPPDPLVRLLSPPPCDSCAQTKIELEELQTLQRNRSEAQARHALADYKISVARFIEGADITFDAAALDKCMPIFERLSERTKSAAEHAKNAFCRTRPYNLPDNGLKPLDASRSSPSYPSGHTTFGTAVGAVLSQMVPEKRGEFLARAADYGHSRMIAGVHYRSDVEAGKVLGTEVAVEEFASDSQFKTMFPDATKCVREALGFAAAVSAVDSAAPSKQ
jgi:acid phosphatase (class A)